MKTYVYRVGSRRLRAKPRSGARKPARVKRLWAPYKHREPVLLVIGLALILVCMSPVPLAYWYRTQAERNYEMQTVQGKPALAQVEDIDVRGRFVLPPNTAYDYDDPFPTSGPHDRDWVAAGFYESPRAPTLLVHALARGNVVIYYDKLQQPLLETLKDWAGLFRGERDGLIVLGHPGLGSEVVLTAWGKRLRLPQFDPGATAAFIDAFRGGGPEKSVR